MQRTFIKLVWLVVSLFVTACEPFDPGSLIAAPRVLGAVVSVEGDETRAEVRPGETANITWIVRSPDAEPMLRWAFIACSDLGEAGSRCADEVLAFSEGNGTVPVLPLQVPESGAFKGAKEIQVLGIICHRGQPSMSAHGEPSCEGDDGEGTLVTLAVHVAQGTEPNRNPDLSGTEVKLDDEAWSIETSNVTFGDCRGDDALPQVRAGGRTRKFFMRLGASARELVKASAKQAPHLEPIQISHFVTAGELAGQFSFVEEEDQRERPEVVISWDPPKADDVPKEGKLVRFIAVVRDLRGGLAVTERALCLVK